MKSRYFVIVLLLIFSLKADQSQQTFVSVSVVDGVESVFIEQCVDASNAQWSKIKHDCKEGKFCEALFAVLKYFKKRLNEREAQISAQQKQLDEQKKQIELIITNQTAAKKKQESDCSRHDKMYKHMQQSFFENNKFSGG